MKSIKNKILVLFFGLFIFALSACQIGDSGGGGAINKEIEYVVKFNDYDGTLLKEEKVKKNESATAPEDPVREGYIFTGWSEDFSNVTKNLTVVAEYEKHEHEYTTKVTDPTCLEKGYTTYTCSCGESYVDDYVDALGHNMITDERVEPTCVNTGLTEGSHCSRCDYTTCKEIAALNHNLVIHESKEATCTEKGWEVYECTRCSYTTYREIVGDHNIVSTVIEPGLITEGYTIDSCSYCDYLYIHSYIPQILNLELEDDFYVVTGVNDSSIVDITIPETYNDLPVKAIGVEAFLNCTSLTNIEIPSSVTSIGSSAFYKCSSLTSIVIPDSVTSIEEYAFYGCVSLKSITIPNSVTSIGSYAFRNCSSLTSITIPNRVISIGTSAFALCYSLTSVYYSGTIEDWCNMEFNDSSSNLMCQASYLFMLNESNEYFLVTDLVIPDAITSIGDYQFYGFNALESITIPNSVTSIGDSAFYFCYSLESITIPNSVTSIGNNAFVNCDSLSSIVIPNSVTSIGDSTFYNCRSLTSVEMGDSVTSIGDYAFYLCSSLTNIIIPNSVTSIGDKAFYFCDSLTSIVIPNSVTSIGSHVFAGCENLKIYCEARSKPSGWDSYWNSWGNHVVWGYKK